MSRALKILILSSEPPYPPTHGGARLKLFHVLKQLSSRHEFTLLTLLEEPHEREYLPALEKFCKRIHAFDPTPSVRPPGWRDWRVAPYFRKTYTESVVKALRNELATQPYDLVHVDLFQMAVYTPLLAGQRKIIAANDSGVLAFDDRLRLAHAPREIWRALRLAWGARAYERRYFPQYDACVMVAERDAALTRRQCPTVPVHVIPNGIDLISFQTGSPTDEQPGLLVFTGTMDYGPNVDAACWFAREILPAVRKQQPDARFEIVGRNPTESVRELAHLDGVTVTGAIPDLRPYLRKAAVFVCPLRTGSGMKNKTLEAMATGKAIVTTSEGVSGIGGTSGEQYVVANNLAEFAAAVVTLCRNAGRRQQLGQAARAFVETRFSWERTAQMYDELYHQVADR